VGGPHQLQPLLSDRPFLDKRDHPEGGSSTSPLRLERWDVDAMRRHRETLAAWALDLNVSQEVLKLTIAYKAETNVVDIVSQAKRLRLSLNRPFAELDDTAEAP
jgi:hypothetical protein